VVDGEEWPSELWEGVSGERRSSDSTRDETSAMDEVTTAWNLASCSVRRSILSGGLLVVVFLPPAMVIGCDGVVCV